MDGRGRWMDNVFIERLWRSLKYEDIYLKGYADGREAARGIAEWIAFYNDRRPHQALADRTPMAVWREAIAGAEGCGHDGQRLRVAHMPTAAEADAASRCVIERNDERPRFQLRNRLKRSRCAGPFQSGASAPALCSRANDGRRLYRLLSSRPSLSCREA